ncbi:MAG: DinB family protein [Pyrinomonadaceae bacterium]|nr:DinB family protein [Pyrinomonadaceae bacterium]
MKKTLFLTISLAAILMASTLSFAQEKKPEKTAVKGVQAELIALMQLAEDRFLALAEVTPQEKYSWRPAKGVRSIGEVYTHMIQANYGLPNFVGVKPPADAPKDLKEITDKKEIIGHLKKSFAHTRKVVAEMSDAQLETPTKFFGNDTTFRGVLSFMNSHTNQHLGQSIAYSRMNGIVPPWNAANN